MQFLTVYSALHMRSLHAGGNFIGACLQYTITKPGNNFLQPIKVILNPVSACLNLVIMFLNHVNHLAESLTDMLNPVSVFSTLLHVFLKP